MDVLEAIADGTPNEDKLASLIRNAFQRPFPVQSEGRPEDHWETERLANQTWEGLVDTHRRKTYFLAGSDLRFLSLEFLAYFLPAYLLVGLQGVGDIPWDVDDFLDPNGDRFRRELRGELSPEERTAIREYIRFRAGLLVATHGPPTEWEGKRTPLELEELQTDFAGYERAYEWWSGHDGG
jgi:hypothetical protein